MSFKFEDSVCNYPKINELKLQIEQSSFISQSKSDFSLSYDSGRLEISSSKTPSVFCDFTNKKFITEIRQSYGRSEGVYSFLRPIAKNNSLSVCDLTVGMGRDFFKFILAGHKVTGFERNPIFYHLVDDGVRRFLRSDTIDDLKKLFKVNEFKINFRYGEAKLDENFDLTYYDPMFEELSKKAAPKKGMQVLKALSTPNLENEKLNTLKMAKLNSNKLVYKCAKKPKDFSYAIQKEIKGKGFSYLVL